MLAISEVGGGMFGLNDNQEQDGVAAAPPPVMPPVSPGMPFATTTPPALDPMAAPAMVDQPFSYEAPVSPDTLPGVVAPTTPIPDPMASTPVTPPDTPDGMAMPSALADPTVGYVPPDTLSPTDTTTPDETAPTDTEVPAEDQPKISSHNGSTLGGAPVNPPDNEDELLEIKKQALESLTPLVDELEQTPEEKFKTTMMLIQASDNADLVKEAFSAANSISDEKARAQALLDVVNEINYFTQPHENEK